jgi:prevent-host-death family protein
VNKFAIFEAKNRLTHIIREAEKGDTVELTRHGKPVAVLVGMEKYAELQGCVRSFSRVFDEFQAEWPAIQAEGPMELAEGPVLQAEGSIDLTGSRESDIDPFENVRSIDTGRDISL